MNSPSDSECASVLGRYRLIRCLGRGGMGVVYEAWDEERGQRFALKTLPAETTGALLDFKNEFRRVADVVHDNLVMLDELSLSDGTWFISMELVDGVDFLSYVRGDKAPRRALDAADLERLTGALAQTVAAISALHSQGLLHLDIKPSNVMVRCDGRVKVLDFGLVQPLSSAVGSSSPRALGGTPLYVSPEQVSGGEPGESSDWYAVGVMLYQALTGVAPFVGSTWDVLALRTRGPAPDPLLAVSEVAPHLRDLCRRLLEPDPTLRARGEDVLCSIGAANAEPLVEAEGVQIPREAELATLSAWLEEARAGRTLYGVVSGRSGMGKSTLSGRFLAELEAGERALVLSARCYERESVPFKGADAVFDALFRHLAALPPRERRSLLDSDLPDLVRLFPVFADLDPGSLRVEAATHQDPREQRRAAVGALQRLLKRVSSSAAADGKALVLNVDDLHFGDADSARLLFELLAHPEPPRLLLLACLRDEELETSPFVREWRALQDAATLRIEERALELLPLSAEGAGALAGALLGGPRDDERVELIARESAGSPFLVNALARHAASARRGEGVVGVTLDRIVDAALARMPASARRLLDVVAAAGGPIEQSLACAAAGASADAYSALAQLRGARLLRARGMAPSDPLDVCHDRIRAVVLERLSEEIPALHRSLAYTLEASGRAQPERLAHHFALARELGKASSYAERAGDEARAALAFERAASLYENARSWDTASTSERLRSLVARRAEALYQAGRSADAAPLYWEAAAGAPGGERRELERLAAEAHLLAGHVDRALSIGRDLLARENIGYPQSPFRAAIGLLASILRLRLSGVAFEPRSEDQIDPNRLFAVDLCWTLGKGLTHTLPAEGTYFIVRALTLALDCGEPGRVGRGLAFVGASVLGGAFGAARQAEIYLSRAEELAQARSDRYLFGAIGLLRALDDLARLGDFRRAFERAENARELLQAHPLGAHWERNLGTAIAMKCLEMKGHVGAFGDRAEIWRREAAERGDLFAEVMASQCCVLHLMAQDRLTEARERDAAVLERWAREGYTVQRLYSLMLRVACDLYEGNTDSARRTFYGDWPRIKRALLLGLGMARIPVLYLKAHLSLEEFRRRRTRSELRAVRSIAASLGRERRRDARAHSLMLLAGVAACRGRRKEASAHLEACITKYSETGMELHAACALRRRGELEASSDLVATSEHAMRELGVRVPERWAMSFAPDVFRTT